MRIKVRDRKYDKRDLYGFHIPEFYYVEGDQIETPKWVDYQAITLRTGPGKYDFRIIDAALIAEMDFVAYKKEKVSSQEKVVEVKGSKGDLYKVTLGKHNSCTCHAFMFRKSCKHIKQAMEAA